MKILLDTHILLWLLTDDEKLSDRAKNIVDQESNKIYFSPLSIWEVELKLKAHPDQMPVGGEQVLKFCKEAEFTQLPVKISHILAIKNLKRPENILPHKDPFDNLLLTQSIVEDMIFMTHDQRIAEYDSKNIFAV